MPAAGDQALEHRLASKRRIQVKGLWIELARERNYLFLGDLVGTRLESVASFEIFEVTLAHRELFFCRIAPVSAMCKVRRNFLERAVSSVVEHLVYTERVGGSKPSPPSLRSQRGGERRLSRRSPATAGRKDDLFHLLATSTRRASTRQANQR